jgi:hypothetical protein
MCAPLGKYLNDHLAGAAFAIDLLRALRRKHKRDGFSSDIESLLLQIEDDRDELRRVAKRVGIQPSGFKQALARLLEKLSRPKLIKSHEEALSSFQAFEMLALGILGKQALWDALSVLDNLPVREVDLLRLKQRAKKQHAVAEKVRLDLAAVVFPEQ